MIDFLKFFVVQSYFISNQCNKFGVCRLALSRAYGISEQIIDRIHLASAPRNLNGMGGSHAPHGLESSDAFWQ